MASVGQHRAGPPPLGPQTYHTKAIRATPSGITSCLKPNLLKLAEAHSHVGTAWQCRWAICDPQVALPLLGNPACWRRQNQQPPALLKLQNLSFQKEDHPYLVAEIRLEIRAKFRAGVGHPHVGSPPLGRQTYVAKAIRATPSTITSCLKPILLKLTGAHSPLSTAWQCRWATCDPQVALPLLGNPACWGSQNQQPPALRKSHKRVPTSRITPTWTPNLRH